MRLRHALTGLLLALVLPSPAAALGVPLYLGAIPVGTLSTIGPTVVAPSGGSVGVNFWASRSLDPATLAVSEENLRWLQRVTFSKSVVGFPDRPFIDPRTGQAVGSARGDALPWYDVTGTSQGSLSLTGGGDDAWAGDGPRTPLSLAPLSFSVETLVVAIDEDAGEVVILGGVGWGYQLDRSEAAALEAIGPVGLGNTAALGQAFNVALALDFPTWRVVVVPEPGTAGLLLTGLALLALGARGADLRAASRGSRSRRG